MGRGDRPSPSGAVPGRVGASPRHPVVLADKAKDEFAELIAHIRKDSPKNAGEMFDAISARLLQLGANPRVGHADPSDPPVPESASGLITVVKKVAIYYLFPLAHEGREIVFVLGIRRGSRMPLDQPDYVRRWLEELAKFLPASEPPVEGPPQE